MNRCAFRWLRGAASRGVMFGGLICLIALPMILTERVLAQPPTVFQFPWDWHISVQPNLTPGTTPNFGDPIPIWLWGRGAIAFGAPIEVSGNPSAPPTFDLGPGGVGPSTPSAEPPPLGGVYEIPIEIVALELHSMMPVVFPQNPTPTDVILRLNPDLSSTGRISGLQNLGDGTVRADSFFDVFVEIELPQLGMTLRNQQPMTAGMSFGPTLNPNPEFGPPAPPVGQLDVPWIPTWLWREFFNNENAPPWIDTTGLPWDRWITIHGHVTVPEPASVALLSLGLAAAAFVRRRR